MVTASPIVPGKAGRNARAVASHSFGSEVRLTTRLGAPLALGELGWMSTYIVDAILVGRMPHSAIAISASSLGNSLFYAIAFCGIGMLFGLDALVSQAFGRGDREDGLYSLVQSLFLVAVCSPVIIALASLAPYGLRLIHVDPAIVSETIRYMQALRWSAPPLLLYMAVRHYLQATDRPGWVMISLLTANLVNWLFDWLLIYGLGGFHAYGIAGSGWATCVVRGYMLLLLVASLAISLWRAPIELRARAWRPEPERLRALVHLGWPVGLQYLGDLSLASFATVLTSTLGATLLAAHQVVLDLNAFCAMIPEGMKAAAAVRTGQGAGRADLAQVRRAGYAAVGLTTICMAAAAVSFVVAPRLWASVYTTDHAVVAATVPIFLICAVSRVFDGAQVVLQGALRGLGETRIPFLASTGLTWLVGVPLSAVMVFHWHMQLVGVWLGGLAATLPLFALMVGLWYRRVRQFGA
jgi:MATE family multidrug resistance protein